MAEIPNYPSKNNLVAVEVTDKKKEPDKVAAVATAKIKKNKWQEFASAFFEEDIQDVKGYIFKEVFVKGVKDIIFEAFRAFWYPGGGGGRRGGSSGMRRAHTSYESYYDDRNISQYRPSQRAVPRTSSFDITSIVFDTRKQAQDVLDQLVDYQQEYGRVTVSRLYDFSGLTPPTSSNKYGWYSLSGSETVTIDDGYGLRLPKPEPIR